MENSYRTWLKYHKGKLLLLADRLKEARSYIIPIVRLKKNESWAWNILGNTFIEEDINKAIACLCKALQLSKQDDFTVNIRVELSELLEKIEDYDSAKYEINRVVEFKKAKGHNISESISSITKSDWYIQAILKDSNETLYSKYSPIAEDIFAESLEWIPAILTNQTKEKGYYICFKHNNIFEELPAKQKEFQNLSTFKLGAPLNIKVDFDLERKSILKIESRESEKWDLLSEVSAVLEHNNNEKGVSNIIIAEKKSCLAYHDKFKFLRNLEEGTSLFIKGFDFMDHAQKRKFKICDLKVNPERQFTGFFREVTGIINIPYDKNFGFINDYFISPKLIEQLNLKNGYKIRCLLIYSLNNVKKRSNRGSSAKIQVKEWTWRVIKVEEVLSREYISNAPKDDYDEFEDYLDEEDNRNHHIDIYNKSN